MPENKRYPYINKDFKYSLEQPAQVESFVKIATIKCDSCKTIATVTVCYHDFGADDDADNLDTYCSKCGKYWKKYDRLLESEILSEVFKWYVGKKPLPKPEIGYIK